MATPFQHFDKNACANIRSLMHQALEEIESKYGLKFNFSSMTYTSEVINTRLIINLVKPSEAGVNPSTLQYRKNVKLHGYKFGITEDYLDKELVILGVGTVRIAGCSNRKKRMPILVENIKNHKLMWVTTSYLSTI